MNRQMSAAVENVVRLQRRDIPTGATSLTSVVCPGGISVLERCLLASDADWPSRRHRNVARFV